jgi:hypothetical protein
VCYRRLLSAGVSLHRSSEQYEYSHAKYWLIDGRRVGMSTGNWSPSDYPLPTSTAGDVELYPPYSERGWRKTNRDFTVTTDHVGGVRQFQQVFDGDMRYATVITHADDVTCGY